MVFAPEDKDVLVGDGVVAFAIDDVHQRGNLGELSGYMLQQRLAPFLVFVEENNHDHQVSRRGRAYHQCTDKALLITQVEERITLVRKAILADTLPDAVRDVVLQPAFVDIQHLVEHPRDMEAHGIHIVEGLAALYLLLRQPFLIGKRELQLVAIELRTGGAENRQDFAQWHLPDARQVVHDLFLLVFQLLLVGEMLPFATAAHAEVFAERHGALLGILVEVHGFPLGIAVLLARQLDVHHVARSHKGDKDDHLVHSGEGFSLCRHVCNRYLFQQRQLFLLSCQCLSLF